MKTMKTNIIRKVFLYGSLFLTLFLATGCVQPDAEGSALISITNDNSSLNITRVDLQNEQGDGTSVHTFNGVIGYRSTTNITLPDPPPGRYFVIVFTANNRSYTSQSFTLSRGATQRMTFTSNGLILN